MFGEFGTTPENRDPEVNAGQLGSNGNPSNEVPSGTSEPQPITPVQNFDFESLRKNPDEYFAEDGTIKPGMLPKSAVMQLLKKHDGYDGLHSDYTRKTQSFARERQLLTKSNEQLLAENAELKKRLSEGQTKTNEQPSNGTPNFRDMILGRQPSQPQGPAFDEDRVKQMFAQEIEPLQKQLQQANAFQQQQRNAEIERELSNVSKLAPQQYKNYQDILAAHRNGQIQDSEATVLLSQNPVAKMALKMREGLTYSEAFGVAFGQIVLDNFNAQQKSKLEKARSQATGTSTTMNPAPQKRIPFHGKRF